MSASMSKIGTNGTAKWVGVLLVIASALVGLGVLCGQIRENTRRIETLERNSERVLELLLKIDKNQALLLRESEIKDIPE